ncbi:MAG: BrnT family toxin [Pyrinomonadaceae bacterium]
MTYEWDPKKARANLAKHRVSFEEAATVFLDPLAVTYPDPDHSGPEIREITVGHSAKQRVIFLYHTGRGDRTRIIGARKATPNERRQYEESIGQET